MCDKVTLEKIIGEIEKVALNLFAHKLKNIILYGSYARGDNDSESDIDVFLLVDMPIDKLSEYNKEIAMLESTLSLETDECVTVSIALSDLQTYIKYKAYLPYYSNIDSEGVIIYAA